MQVGTGTGPLPVGDLRRRGGLGEPGTAGLRVPGVVSPADAPAVAGQPGRAEALALATQLRPGSCDPPGRAGPGSAHPGRTVAEPRRRRGTQTASPSRRTEGVPQGRLSQPGCETVIAHLDGAQLQ